MEYDNSVILKKQVFSLPIVYSEGTCEETVEKRLSEYITFLEENQIGGEIIGGIKKFKESVSSMFKEYYLGHQNKAYGLFKEAFEYETGGKKWLPVKSVLPKEALYRARTNDGDIDFNNQEMFHIKYEDRGKVKTQRYSFPGLPCLYLGSSSYVCWVELNRPQIEHFQIAEIRQKDPKIDYKVIDLGIHPLAFYKELRERENEKQGEYNNLSFEGYLRWWPIMAVCSVAVKNEKDTFKPEYIFPQFVLQYFLENNQEESVGIRYLSIKAGRVSTNQYDSDVRTYTNYVIPIKSSKTTQEGFCSVLDKQFCITNTISGKEIGMFSGILQYNVIKMQNRELIGKNPLDTTYIYTKSGMRLEYGKSPFRIIEKILSSDAITKLTEDFSGFITDEDMNRIFYDIEKKKRNDARMDIYNI